MQLDPNIILQARQPENPMEMYGKALNLKNMAMQSQAQEQEFQKKQLISDAVKSSIVDGKVDHQAVFGKVQQRDPMAAQAYQEKLQSDMLGKMKRDHEVLSMIWPGVTKDNWRQKRVELERAGVDGVDQIPDDISDEQIKKISNGLLTTKEQLAAQKDARDYELRERELRMRRLERQDTLNEKQQLRQQEKEDSLTTPYGQALTKEDAKNLKSADEEKKNFDQKINEMITLREKHSGGAVLNREDVARAKQLSKDALLSYKNMAKLGVLSQSDEAIINAIIPPDPLEYNSPVAAIQGQDPILNNLKKFKADSDADFQNRLRNRLKAPPQQQVGTPPPPKLKLGDVVDGMVYVGGPANSQASWKQK